jgi:integrase/recombinase XerD
MARRAGIRVPAGHAKTGGSRLPGDASDPHGFPALATAYLEWMAARNYAEATLRSREKLLRFLVEWAELRSLTRPAQVTRPILERYQRYLFHYRQPNGRPLSFASQAQRLMPVRLFFRWLARRNLILSNPAADLELPRKEYRLPKAVLTAQEADRVIDSLPATQPMALRDRAILEVLYSTGMRRKELVGLRLHDVDVERSTVFIRQGKCSDPHSAGSIWGGLSRADVRGRGGIDRGERGKRG